jgi:hypothetical protein
MVLLHVGAVLSVTGIDFEISLDLRAKIHARLLETAFAVRGAVTKGANSPSVIPTARLCASPRRSPATWRSVMQTRGEVIPRTRSPASETVATESPPRRAAFHRPDIAQPHVLIVRFENVWHHSVVTRTTLLLLISSSLAPREDIWVLDKHRCGRPDLGQRALT